MYLYEVPPSGDRANLAGSFGQSGSLRRFSPEELVLSASDALAVLRFFWPNEANNLGSVTDADRGFAQALLVEAVDASCTMGVAESIYKKFLMKVPTSFKEIAKSAARIALEAIKNRWLKRCGSITAADVKIYESVRATLARSFRAVLLLRLQTGELTY